MLTLLDGIRVNQPTVRIGDGIELNLWLKDVFLFLEVSVLKRVERTGIRTSRKQIGHVLRHGAVQILL